MKASYSATPERRVLAYIPLILAGIILFFVIPLSTGYIEYLAGRMLVYAIFALSLNLLFGYTGLFPLGHAAYLGLGGYAAAILMVRLGIGSFWVVAPLSILITANRGCRLWNDLLPNEWAAAILYHHRGSCAVVG